MDSKGIIHILYHVTTMAYAASLSLLRPSVNDILDGSKLHIIQVLYFVSVLLNTMLGNTDRRNRQFMGILLARKGVPLGHVVTYFYTNKPTDG